ncbi:hypothetical protein H0H81_004769 [Sphagnurus paluster]|uniref:Uncharacterized protein n=1 Tax=Sphagnurus paluster TaxID=117069 RepID=A0A9P7FPI2_9AGAR|nr:hypothetical protein H0H81_004769 [Sphagnurus paluster]
MILEPDEAPRRYHQNLLYLLESRNATDYKERCKQTSISGVSIFSSLSPHHRLPIPSGFPGDSMHAPTLNLGDLLIPMWRGTFQCATTDNMCNWDWATLKDDIWIKHGEDVGSSKPYLPGFFDHPPRNIEKKGSSGYKAKEYQGYFYGLGPALLFGILLHIYWEICKIVYAIRILHQHSIPSDQLIDTQKHLVESCLEFEALYGQRRTDRLHMVRPVVHVILHMAAETVCLGPVSLYSTWTMERMIGSLGREIHQPSKPYQNLSEWALIRCQTNSLLIAFPELDPKIQKAKTHSSTTLVDLGDGYSLLHARDEYGRVIPGAEGKIIKDYIIDEETQCGNEVPQNWNGPKVFRWAHLQLPNGQIAQSA